MSEEDSRAVLQTPSFTRKQISVTFNIVMPDGSTQSLTLENDYQMKATVTHAGMSIGSELDLDIWGLSPDDMNILSCAANYPNALNHTTMNQSSSTVIVRVGNYGQPLTTLFTGLLEEGYVDPSGSEPVFHVHAMTSTLLARIVPNPMSYRGPRNVISILSDVCTASGLQLIDHGGWDRYATLTNTYLEGTALQRFRKIVEQTCRGVYNYVPLTPRTDRSDKTVKRESYRGVVNVWGPAYGGRKKDEFNDTTPLISAETGLVDFPKYSRSLISFTCFLRTDIAYYQPLKLESLHSPRDWNQPGGNASKAPWSGIWYPTSIRHEVASETRDGSWHTSVDCNLADTGMKKNAVK